MDFKTYRAKIIAFHRVFEMLGNYKQTEIENPSGVTKRGKELFADSIRGLISQSTIIDTENCFYGSCSVGPLSSLDDVNLEADLETLEKQAEAVKDEIIQLGKFCSLCIHTKKVGGVLTFTDFIRSPRGEIVYPFNYWTDCIEVYLRKFLKKQTNGRIANNYNFISTKGNNERAKLALIVKLLEEIAILIESVESRKFPPLTLRGGKQPSMIN